MTTRLLIEQSPAEMRAALIRDNKVWGLWYEQDMAADGLYLGRVKTIDRKLQAAFVDIGKGQDGFLPLSAEFQVEEGAAIPVRIKRPASSGKGALLTTQTGLKAEALKSLIASVGGNAPAQLGEQVHPAVTAFTHFAPYHPTEVLIAGTKAQLCLQAHLASTGNNGQVDVVQNEAPALFEQEGVEEAIEQVLSRVVPLTGGGRLVFDEAEALTAIDIDIAATSGQSKRGSIIKACTMAIPEIIRQISLRRIGGQIVIDFPALALKGGGQIRAVLKEEIRKLKGTRLARLDDSGLAVLIRSRNQLSLLDLLTEYHGPGPVQGRRLSARALAADLLRKTETALQQNPPARLEALAVTEVTELIAQRPDWTNALQERYGPRLKFSTSEGREREWFDVREVS